MSSGEPGGFPRGSPLDALLAAPVRPGEVVWLGVRPARGIPPAPVAEVLLDPEGGLAGDHYSARAASGSGGRRQVTLVEAEQLAAIAASLGREAVEPAELRRNVVVRGINLHAIAGGRFKLGGAVLEATGACHPCSRMERALGSGGYNAVRGRGGLTARILSPGLVRIGDRLERLGDD